MQIEDQLKTRYPFQRTNSPSSNTWSYRCQHICWQGSQNIPEDTNGIDEGDLEGQRHELEVDDLHGRPNTVIGFQCGEITLSRRSTSETSEWVVIPLRTYALEPFCRLLRQESWRWRRRRDRRDSCTSDQPALSTVHVQTPWQEYACRETRTINTTKISNRHTRT